MPAEKGQRRCFMTGQALDKAKMIRFVVGPEKQVYPDITGKLEGRGVWLTASRSLLQQAVDKKMFSKAFRLDVQPVPKIVSLTSDSLENHCLHLLGLANKAGVVVKGFQKIKETAHKEKIDVLIEASDAARDGHEKLCHLLSDAFCADDWTSEVLSKNFGHDFCVHVAMRSGKMAQNFKKEVLRYRSFNEIRKKDS